MPFRLGLVVSWLRWCCPMFMVLSDVAGVRGGRHVRTRAPSLELITAIPSPGP